MKTRPLVILIFSLGLLIWGQYWLLIDYDHPALGLLLIAPGLVAASYAYWHLAPQGSEPAIPQENLPGTPHPAPSFPPPESPLLSAVQPILSVGLILMSVVVATFLAIQAHQRPLQVSYTDLFALWGISMACFLAANLRPGELRERWHTIRQDFRTSPYHWAFVLALAIFALLVRTVALEDVPYPFSFDEVSFAHRGAQLVSTRAVSESPFEPDWLSHPRLFFLMIGLSTQVFGHTAFAARLPSAVFGALTVPAVYALGHALYGKRVGLVAAVYMAGFHLHVHFSRIALNNVIDPLWAVLGFAWLLRGLRGRRLSDFALAGVAFGMSQYFYAASRLIPILAAAFLILVSILHPEWLRGRWLHLGVLVLGALIVTWPADWFYIVERQPLTRRLAATGLVQTGEYEAMRQEMDLIRILWEQLKNATLALIHTHDRSDFYGAIAPVMGRYAGVPFLLGGLYGLLGWWQQKKCAALLLAPLWVAATVLAGGALLALPPIYPRYILLTPAAALLVGVGIVETIRLVSSAAGTQAERARLWGMVGIGALLMSADLAFYFDPYRQSQLYTNNYNALIGNMAARYLLEEVTGGHTPRVYYMMSEHTWLAMFKTTTYFVPDIAISESGESGEDLPSDLYRPGGSVFIIEGSRAEELSALQRRFPGGEVTEYRDDRGNLMLVIYHVRAEEP